MSEPAGKNAQGIPLRSLGKTGVKVPIIGLGGGHVVRNLDEPETIRLIQAAQRV